MPRSKPDGTAEVLKDRVQGRSEKSVRDLGSGSFNQQLRPSKAAVGSFIFL